MLNFIRNTLLISGIANGVKRLVETFSDENTNGVDTHSSENKGYLLYRLSKRGDSLICAKGKSPGASRLSFINELLLSHSVQSGTITARDDEGMLRISFSSSIPDSIHQQIRNCLFN